MHAVAAFFASIITFVSGFFAPAIASNSPVDVRATQPAAAAVAQTTEIAGNPFTDPAAASAVAATIPAAAPAPAAPPPPAQTTINQPVIERIIERIVPQGGTISAATLTVILADFEESISERIAALDPPTATIPAQVAAGGSATGAFFPASQRIDQLTNTTINSPTISGGTISNATVSGTLSGTFSGTSSFTAATTSSLAISSIPWGLLSTDGAGNIVATSTPTAASFIATSTIASQFPYASSTSLTVSGTGFFGTASTTNFNLSGTANLQSISADSLLYNNSSKQLAAATVGSGLSFAGSSLSLNVGNGNVWTALQQFSAGASTTQVSALDALYVGRSATTTIRGDGVASVLPYASTTAFSVSGTAYFPGSGIWNSSGNVGLGTTTPLAKLTVEATNPYVSLNPSTAGKQTGLLLYNNSTFQWHLGSNYNNAGDGNFFIQRESGSGNIIFAPNGSGNVGIGTTTPAATLGVAGAAYFSGRINVGAPTDNSGAINLKWTPSGEQGINLVGSNETYNGNAIRFMNSSLGTAGAITQSTNSVAYNTTSDRRLKENIATSTLGLDTLLALPVKEFSFVSDPSHAMTIGFIAQELHEIFPWAVTTYGNNGTDPLTATTTPWSIDYGRVTPLIVKAMQDIANIAGTFKANLIAWLADAGNGIGDFFANNIHARGELCVGSTCVTESQLQAMLAATGQAAVSPSTDTPADAPQPPVIELNGNASSTISVGASYTDLGVRITAPQSDLNLGIVILLDGATTTAVSLDTSAPGEHTILYTVTSPTSGLTGSAMRTVIIAPAVQPPEQPKKDNPFNTPPANDNVSTSTLLNTEPAAVSL